MRQTITNKLREAFSPESLEVQDESHLHEGHAGHRPGGETHFRVHIVSQAFKGKSVKNKTLIEKNFCYFFFNIRRRNYNSLMACTISISNSS